MRIVKAVCDRCGAAILERGTVVGVTAGELRNRYSDPLDLCPDCGERFGCLQFRQVLKWYSHLTRVPRSLHKRLINLSSPGLFDEVLAIARAAGPESAPPGNYEVHVSVPSGAIGKW
jgi:hypothetical protein